MSDIFQKIHQMYEKSNAYGFRWSNDTQLIEQLQSELNEVREVLETSNDPEALREELGDLLHATFHLCFFKNLDPKETLEKNLVKLQKRFDALVRLSQQDGFKTLENQPREQIMYYWNKAKAQVG